MSGRGSECACLHPRGCGGNRMAELQPCWSPELGALRVVLRRPLLSPEDSPEPTASLSQWSPRAQSPNLDAGPAQPWWPWPRSLWPSGRERAGLTGDGVYEVVELPLEDVQRVAQDLAVVSLALGDQVQLLLHCAADGGEHELCICKWRGPCEHVHRVPVAAPNNSGWSPETPGLSWSTQKILCGGARDTLSLGLCHSSWNSSGQVCALPSSLVPLEPLGEQSAQFQRRTYAPPGAPNTSCFGFSALVRFSTNRTESLLGRILRGLVWHP